MGRLKQIKEWVNMKEIKNKQQLSRLDNNEGKIVLDTVTQLWTLLGGAECNEKDQKKVTQRITIKSNSDSCIGIKCITQMQHFNHPSLGAVKKQIDEISSQLYWNGHSQRYKHPEKLGRA